MLDETEFDVSSLMLKAKVLEFKDHRFYIDVRRNRTSAGGNDHN